MQIEARVPLSSDTLKDKGFLADLYFRRNGTIVEIGLSKQDGKDYAWSEVAVGDLSKIMSLLGVAS